MQQEAHQPTDLESIFSQWMNTVTTLWTTMAQSMTGSGPAAGPGPSPGSEETLSDRQATWQAMMKNWDVVTRFILDPSGVQSILKGLNTLPDMLMKLGQGTWEGLTQVQERWQRYAEKQSKKDLPYSFQELDREFLNRWTDVYEQEFSRFFKIPQLGLARCYMEDMNAAMDAFNRCQASVTEFLHLLYLPLERSHGVLQEKIAAMAETGQMPEDPKALYRLWVKILEGYYMNLFKSGEYAETMGKTLHSINGFLSARKKVLEAMMQSLPVATHKDLDALYEEVYRIKKRLNQLEKDRGQER